VKYIILYILFFLCSSTLVGQKIEPKLTFNVELGLPVALKNEPFNDVMQGLAAASVYGQYSLPFHLNFGAGVRYSLFTINEFSVPGAFSGNVQTAAGFFKVGYDKYATDKLAYDFGVRVGYSFNFSNVKELNPEGETIRSINNQISALMVEPHLGLILAVDEKNAYRFSVGYNIVGYGFKPSFIGIESNSGWDPNGFSEVTQFLIVGFGYTHYFIGKK